MKAKHIAVGLVVALIFGWSWWVWRNGAHKEAEVADSGATAAKEGGSSEGGAPTATEIEPPPVFHPDQVTTFIWETGGKKQIFHRPTRDLSWAPSVSPEFIQKRLDRISFLHLRPSARAAEIQAHARVKVTIGIERQEPWEGAWDGERFVWKTGPKQGYEAVITERDSWIFEEGALAFAPRRSIEICHERPAQIGVASTSGRSFVLRQNGLKWIISDSKAPAATPSKEVDPTAAEKWIGEHCLVSVDTFVDGKIKAEWVSSVRSLAALSFSFAKQPGIVIEQVAGDLFRMKTPGDKKTGTVANQVLFRSQRLARGLENLNQMDAKAAR